MDNNEDLLVEDLPPPLLPPPLPPRPVFHPQQPVNIGNFRLQPFWPDAPVAWFGGAEAQFRLRRVVEEADKFCLLVAALDKEAARSVTHLIADPDLETPYTRLKEALLASHLLTDFQRVERLVAMEPLGARKPSQLLAEMMELCPREEHGSKLFAALFLQRLPREIRVLLAHDDHSDLRLLAVKADQLIAFHKQQPHEVAVVEEDTVAAVRHGGKPSFKSNKKKGTKPPLPPPRQKDGPPPPLELAQQAAGLCWYHWVWGEQAKKCTPPCTWSGTKN